MNTPAKMARLAKVLAPLMTGKPVQVTISGQQAYTTESSINIPAGDFENPSYVTMVHGYIDHELGHNAFTDFDVSRTSKAESATLHKFRNALEDVRMERLQSEAWPGAKINLNNLATLCVKKGNFPSIDKIQTPTQQVLYFCLYWGRYHINEQHALGPLVDDAESFLLKQLGDSLVNLIMSELTKLKSAKSNQDCLDIARAILKLLEDEADNSDEDEEDDSETSGEQDDQDDSEQSEGDGDDGQDESDDDEEQGDNSGDSGVDDDSDDSDDAPEDQPEQTAKQFIRSILDADDDDDIEDIHHVIAKELGALASESRKDDRVTDLGGFTSQLGELQSARPGLSIDVAEAKSAGRRVYKTIRRALIDSSMNQRVFAQTGRRVAKSRLAGVKAGSQSVFERRFVKPEPTAAVSILVDASGSMHGNEQRVVGSAALAMAYGLNTSKIKVQTTFYGVEDGVNPPDHIYRAKRFEDKSVVSESFSVLSTGGTPTGHAMQAEILQLINRREDKKFLFVLTDGEPNDPSKVASAIEAAKMMGIRVIPIGICTTRMRGFDGLSFQSVGDLSELDGALKHALSEGLLN